MKDGNDFDGFLKRLKEVQGYGKNRFCAFGMGAFGVDYPLIVTFLEGRFGPIISVEALEAAWLSFSENVYPHNGYELDLYERREDILFLNWLCTGNEEKLKACYSIHKEVIRERFFLELSKKTEKKDKGEVGVVDDGKKRGYVYLLKTSGKYKIGRTVKPDVRLKKYQTENPEPIEVAQLEMVYDYIGVEQQLLRDYAEKNIHGEWFDLNDKDIESIEKTLRQHKDA